MSNFKFRKNLIRNSLLVMSAFFLTVASGCGSSMKAVKTDEKTGYFPGSKKVEKGEIYLREKVDMKKYKKAFAVLPLKYVDNENRKNTIPTDFDEFFKKSITAIGYFDSVVDKKTADALVAQVTISRITSFDYSMLLVVSDPESSKPVLKIMKTAANDTGLDEPLFYPVLNAFIDWIKENK